MPAPTIGTRNEGQFAGGSSVAITLSNAPSAGGLIVVCGAFFTGNATGGPSVSATGGSGIVITERVDTTAGSSTIGVGIWTVEYSTAPSSLTVALTGAGSSGYASASCLNLSGQDASYLDVVSTGTNGTGTAPVDTNLPNITDANSIVIGVMTRDGTSGTIGPGTNWTQVTELDEANSTQTLSVIQRSPGATGSYDPTWTLSVSDTWRVGGIAIKGAAGGGPVTVAAGGSASTTAAGSQAPNFSIGL